MNIYILYEIFIVIIGISMGMFSYNKHIDLSKNVFFIFVTFILLVVISGFRGNMGTDYLSYQYIYEYEIRFTNFKNILASHEMGYAMLQKIVGELSNYNIVWLMTTLAIITIFSYYKFWIKKSECFWLTLVLLLSLGSYYTSFNTTRQFMVAAMFLLCIKYIENKNIVMYLISILFLSLFHQSAIYMIPMYFIFRINWFDKKYIIEKFVLIILCLIGILFSSTIINLGVGLYSNYADTTFTTEGNNILTLIRFVIFSMYLLYNRKNLNMNSIFDRICFNSSILLLICGVISLKVTIFYRMVYYFLPLTLTGIVNVTVREKNRKKQFIEYCLIIIFVLIYIIIVQKNLKYEWFFE